ncbi:MAG: 16S rRNA (cytosine(1402)-N(4))-methyltransferase RsmH [Candidatus Puniceispirillaceae bacterium]
MMPEQQLPHQALHQSVLLREVVAALSPADDAIYLDATFGNGGYSRALLEAAGCKVIAIDRDPDAIQRGQPMLAEFAGRFSLVEGCFSQMAGLLDPEVRLAGAAFDLGVCSTQLDQPERGFSFRTDGPLDMRMSKSGDSAADVVMQADERMLAQILWDYGEEKASRRIARAIVSARRDDPITTTSQLAAIIHAVMPAKRPGQIDPATRSFQALRIYINRELDELTDGLAAVEAMLEPGGILAVVSFHSLEDRIVKRFLTARSQAAARPSRHMPDIDGPAPTFELLGRKAVVPSASEQAENSRARSAKLRVACRTKAPAIAANDDTPHRQRRS